MTPDVLTPRERTQPAEPDSPVAERRRVPYRDVLVALVVCLGLWAVLFAPILERNARTGPVGTRRSVSLAVLRPITSISDALGITSVASGALRALGEDPDAQPGGELDLPDFEVPPLPSLASGPTADGGGHGPDGDGEQPEIGPVRNPTPNNPLRVAVVGDSLSQGLGVGVEQAFNANVTRVLSLGKQSTGLSRQDYFNWPRAMREIETGFRPDIVFIMLGTNDGQAQISSDGASIPVGSTAWVAAYRERAAAFLREATSQGTRVVWVGLPIVRDKGRWNFYRRVNDIYEQVAASDPLATYVDTWDPLEARDGGYTAFLRNERGVVQEMRSADGMHFTPTGYSYLARLAIRSTDEAFELPERAVTFRLGGPAS
jgi:lysophospholipase L1-like esterase